MVIGVPKEILADERRVALVPERVAVLVAAGQDILVETGAGRQAFYDDAAYVKAGAQLAPDNRTLYAQSDMVVKVRAPALDPVADMDELELLREESLLVALLDPLQKPWRIQQLAERGITSFS